MCSHSRTHARDAELEHEAEPLASTLASELSTPRHRVPVASIAWLGIWLLHSLRMPQLHNHAGCTLVLESEGLSVVG